MCAVCTEWENKQITSKEAFRIIGIRLSATKDKAEINHLKQASEKIISTEVPETQQDEELNARWADENKS